MDKTTLRKLLIGEFTWKRLIRSVLFIYTFFALYVFFRADSMIFLPPPASYQDTQDILKLPVTDSQQISALHLPNPDATYTLLYIHGNAEDLGDIRPKLEDLHRWGFSVFAYDYRGYGTSDGKPSERNAYQDITAAYRAHLGSLSRGYKPLNHESDEAEIELGGGMGQSSLIVLSQNLAPLHPSIGAFNHPPNGHGHKARFSLGRFLCFGRFGG